MTTWDHQQVYVGVFGTDPAAWEATVDMDGRHEMWGEALLILERDGYELVVVIPTATRDNTHSEAFLAFFKRPAVPNGQEPVFDQFLTE